MQLPASLPRLGLITSPSPITALPDLAEELDLASFHVKRDDLLPALFGGSKVRKLDYLLASEPYASAPGFVGIGAIGSGLLVALTAAAERIKKPLHAHCFHEDIDAQVLDNLAFVTSRAERVDFYGSRAALALRRPQLFTRTHDRGYAIVPPGATNVAGMVGIVAAALELKAQIDASDLPAPNRVYVAFGSGGTAAGLSVGLALAGLRCELFAITAIEKPFSREAYVEKLTRELIAWLTKSGVAGISGLKPLPVQIDRSALGKGYGRPTQGSIAACERLRQHGVWLEPIYSGKAMSAVLAERPASPVRVLFWQTNRGAAPTQDRPWQHRLPGDLRQAVL